MNKRLWFALSLDKSKNILFSCRRINRQHYLNIFPMTYGKTLNLFINNKLLILRLEKCCTYSQPRIYRDCVRIVFLFCVIFRNQPNTLLCGNPLSI